MRWYGKIGYSRNVEISPGVYDEIFEEREYRGDLIRASRNWNDSNTINGTLTISNQISILSDPYILDNFHDIRYAEFMDIKWKVTSVELQHPRLLLTLGGEYNGKQT